MFAIDPADGFAFCFFLLIWLGYTWLSDHGPWAGKGLSHSMNRQRDRWMEVLFSRDLRMIDTAIMAGLQQGTAFFASACIFAIGGTFALLGSADQIANISSDLPFYGRLDPALVEMKLLGLVVIFAYAFFKFGWSYRLFNYCSILVGAIPMREEAEKDPDAARLAMQRAAGINRLAGRHFNAGLRAIFFALAYLGWFLGPYALITTTIVVVAIIANRQYFSAARKVVE